jgi:hypothetical protein
MHLDERMPVEERVRALLAQMTLKEKIGQMGQVRLATLPGLPLAFHPVSPLESVGPLLLLPPYLCMQYVGDVFAVEEEAFSLPLGSPFLNTFALPLGQVDKVYVQDNPADLAEYGKRRSQSSSINLFRFQAARLPPQASVRSSRGVRASLLTTAPWASPTWWTTSSSRP